MRGPDITGLKYGRLTVLREDGKDKRGGVMWLCKCECGNFRRNARCTLVNGIVLSCGCLRKEQFIQSVRSHGLTHSPEWRCWMAIRSRCNNPNNQEFSNYGGRGIKVCRRWNNSFLNFLADMGRKPDPSYTIERINVNRGYSPENCKWIPLKEQYWNMRKTKYVFYEGKRVALGILYKMAPRPITYNAFRGRIRKGWDLNDALTLSKGATR